MWKYLLKRLFIAVPTLLGITVITFCIIRLAPGDPTQLPVESGHTPYEGYLSRDQIERTRKLFGLDRPVFVNLDVKDRRRTVCRAWEKALARLQARSGQGEGIDPDSRPGAVGTDSGVHGPLLEAARKELVALGSRLIPDLVPKALALKNDEHYAFLAGILKEGAGLDEAVDRTTLESWWRARAPSFQGDAIRERLNKLESCPGDEVKAEIRALQRDPGDLILPYVMERLTLLEEGETRCRLIALAAPRAGYPGALETDSELRRYRDAEARLQRWWRQEGLAFREIDAWERVLKSVTETQYAFWLWRILHLDFGESFIDYQPVTGKVWDAFKVTFSFQVIVIFLIYLISVPLGVYSAVKQDTVGDRLVTLFLFM
ncbi:MAG: hypothetical protein KJ645_03635, partial [Planctomycetes bacterium]|nr:hypothetical protein [Planctomycetota bacterium]